MITLIDTIEFDWLTEIAYINSSFGLESRYWYFLNRVLNVLITFYDLEIRKWIKRIIWNFERRFPFRIVKKLIRNLVYLYMMRHQVLIIQNKNTFLKSMFASYTQLIFTDVLQFLDNFDFTPLLLQLLQLSIFLNLWICNICIYDELC